MRGVVSAGMVTGLEQLGLTQTFDVVYGTSAGALNGAYFLAGQAAYGTTIYYENINNAHFIDFRRALSGKPPVSLEYLFDTILPSVKKLDWEKVIHSPIPLKVVASCVKERCAKVFDNFESRDDLFQALKGSARMPAITGPPVEFRGDMLLDGSVYESIPTVSAAKECTHILALRTRPANSLVSPGMTERLIVGPWIRKYNPAMVGDILEQKLRYRKQLDELSSRTLSDESKPYICEVTVPSGTKEVSRMEKRREFLVLGAISGVKAILRLFSEETTTVLETIRAFDRNGHPPAIS
jgi:predicted patatin/cPLA2 family phospholipase